MIVCKCYGTEHKFSSRKKAKDFFLDCMMNSEGSEKERYANILCDLECGKTYCSDGVE